jgi:hypothetical protein
MKHQSLQFICLLLLTISGSLMMVAQTYHITPIVTPANVIDSQAMAGCHQPDYAAISSSGEVAFATYCTAGEHQLPSFVMTSHRIVAKDGDVIDGKHIQIFRTDVIAINARGQVAYTILTLEDGKDPNDPANWHEAICVDQQLVQAVPNDIVVRSLALTDDGKVSVNQPVSTAIAPAGPMPGKQGNPLNKIPFKMPPLKMPKNFPIGIPSIPQIPQTATRSDNHPATAPLPLLTTNSKGQAVIVAGLDGWNFAIFVLTPAN